MISIVKNDFLQVATQASQYVERGIVKFDKVLSISPHARIPNLTHVYGLEKIHALLTSLLRSFNDSLNLIRPMNEQQIVECAYQMVVTTEEDQLSVEDYVLFFTGAKEGKYGKILDRMDSQMLFEMLEKYRTERHITYIRMKEEQHLQSKALPVNDRISEMFKSEGEKMKEAQIDYLKSKVNG